MKLNRFGSSVLYVLYALCSSDKFFPKRQIHWQTSIKQLFRILTSNAFDNMRLFCAIVLWMKSFVFNHIAIERIRWNTTMKFPKNNRFLFVKKPKHQSISVSIFNIFRPNCVFFIFDLDCVKNNPFIRRNLIFSIKCHHVDRIDPTNACERAYIPKNFHEWNRGRFLGWKIDFYESNNLIITDSLIHFEKIEMKFRENWFSGEKSYDANQFVSDWAEIKFVRCFK